MHHGTNAIHNSSLLNVPSSPDSANKSLQAHRHPQRQHRVVFDHVLGQHWTTQQNNQGQVEQTPGKCNKIKFWGNSSVAEALSFTLRVIVDDEVVSDPDEDMGAPNPANIDHTTDPAAINPAESTTAATHPTNEREQQQQ